MTCQGKCRTPIPPGSPAFKMTADHALVLSPSPRQTPWNVQLSTCIICAHSYLYVHRMTHSPIHSSDYWYFTDLHILLICNLAKLKPFKVFVSLEWPIKVKLPLLLKDRSNLYHQLTAAKLCKLPCYWISCCQKSCSWSWSLCFVPTPAILTWRPA